MRFRESVVIVLAALGVLATDAGCDDGAEGDGDADVDGDVDSDTDTDSDADSDADGDTDSDTDADSDTDGDTDADGDADGDTDGDADGPSHLLVRHGTALELEGEPFLALGVNKFDLFHQFLGIASGGAGVEVTRPMALEALDDAAAAGLNVMRVAAVGYWPTDMELWETEPETYWGAFDDMIEQARERGIFLVPVVWWHVFLFADMAGEPLGQTFVPGSASHELLLDYARDMAARYADEPTILFWELTNEINLGADLDYGLRTDSSVCVPCGTPAARSAADCYSTDDMVETLVLLAVAMKDEDPGHLVSAGYASPRANAMHLRASPEWEGADWTHDSIEQLRAYVALTNPDPIDLVSVHFYNGAGANEEFGIEGLFNPDLLASYQEAADLVDRPLYLGEFGDGDPPVSEARESSFARRTALEIFRLRVPVSTHWVWEFYQFAPDEPSPHSIEPGVDDELIGLFSEVSQWLSSDEPVPGAYLAVTNPDFETDDDGDGLADGWETWWRDGTSEGPSAVAYVNPPDVFQGDAALRLSSGTGDPGSMVFALSDPIPVAAGIDVVLSAAVRQNLGEGASMYLTLVEHDDEGSEIGIQEITLTHPYGWRFRVEHLRAALDPATSHVRVRVGAGGAAGTIVDVDDVRLFSVTGP